MGEKNLVQELREIGSEPGGVNALCTGLRYVATDSKCIGTPSGCHKCAREAINALADRIEAEYDPKPEPDTLENVAKEMLGVIHTMQGGTEPSTALKHFVDRLKALGVTFDD